jgi:glucose-1-phosphate thymidylyltransferase
MTHQKFKQFRGIVPAAGKGTRLSLICSTKELISIPYYKGSRSLCEFCIEVLETANINLAYVIISQHKTDLLNFLKDGSKFKMHLGYIYQQEYSGLAHAVDSVYSFIKNDPIVLVLPDTIIYPFSALKILLKFFKSRDEGDMVLGVFDTEVPEKLCQVIYDSKLNVIHLLDKEETIKVKNTWGIIAWKPSFTQFLHEFIKNNDPTDKELTLSEVINSAIDNGLKAIACPLHNFKYLDVGTIKSLKEALVFFDQVCNMHSTS